GVIRELEKQGYEISSVAGTSMGSVVGGIYAMGGLDTFTDFMCNLTQDEMYKLMDFTLTSHGFLKAERIFKKIESLIPDQNIENLRIPFAAVAADLKDRKEVIFTQGSVFKAMRASIAIPAVVTSVVENDKILVDGGILNPLPLNHVKRHEDDLLVAVNLYDDMSSAQKRVVDTEEELAEFQQAEGYLSKIYEGYQSVRNSIGLRKSRISRKQKKKLDMGYISMLNITTTMMSQRIAAMSIEIEKPDVIINIPCSEIGTFDFFKSKELIELGKETTKKVLTDLNK
ncbi:MAG: patatin-like phospholipase family protein, partial [Bacteroidales bacterium]